MQSQQVKTEELRPLRDNDKDYEAIEKVIRALFKREIYLPLIREFGGNGKVFHNAMTGLLEAIRTGRIQFYRGAFSGKLNAQITKDLRDIGAKWDRKTATYKLPFVSLPVDVRNAISASAVNFNAKIAGIDRKLSQILPEEIAAKLNLANHFDATLWKTEKDFNGSLRNITVAPQLSPEARKRIADEWQNNLRLHVADWTQKEVVKLRKGMQQSVFAGNRREAAIKQITESYGVSANKAKFLARQETRLLLTKYKQVRYEEAGVHWYRWGIVNQPIQAKGAPYVKGQVRHDHGVLAGKVFRWDDPPITDTQTGARNNPGQDYNCRCYARPIVKVKTGS
jgi:SPP1 gp7 family putative phage head morphogenesis protein